VATVLVLCFSIALPWFPAVVLYGPDASVGQLLPAVWLPALALATVMAAYIVRMARTSVIDVMASEYVTTARLKGLSTWRVVTRHALP
ncbi:ABC transporter permease subunit, partial [Streptomyces sp. GSL17-113]